ncbi:MAG: mechanosensitive ion channel [Gammaproteobacteria bacterium]|nr:mechanosensitive ion channel [Gammaproteobacteria bacterium]
MIRHTKTCSFSAFILLILASGFVFAQQGSQLTLELIDQRINTLREGGAADGSEPLTIYESARTLLTQEESFLRDAANYEASLTAEPEREEAIQQRLDELDAEYNPALEVQVLTADEITARLSQARIDQRDLRSQIEALDRQLAARETNANTIRERFIQIEARLNEIATDTAPTVDPAATPSVIEASQWRTIAETRALVAENLARESQLESQPVRFSAMAAERAELDLNLTRLGALIQVLETAGAGTARQTASLADLNMEASDPAYPIAVDLIELDEQLSLEQQTLNSRLAAIRLLNQTIEQRSASLEERYSTARRIVDFGGDSESLGRVLITYWQEVESFRVSNPVEALSREIGSAVIRRIDYEVTLSSMVSATAYVNTRLRAIGIEPDSVSVPTRESLVLLARGYRERLRTVIGEMSLFIDESSQLDTGYSQLENRVDEYRDFLQGLLLWIPNYPSLWLTTQPALIAEADYILSALGELQFSPGPWFFILLLPALCLVPIRKRLKEIQISLNAKTVKPRDDSIYHTVASLGVLFLRALPLPLLIAAVGMLFTRSLSTLNEDFQNNLTATSAVFFISIILRIISEKDGIGRVHFNWKDATMDRLFGTAGFLIYSWIPLALAASLIITLSPESSDVAIGRFVLLIAILVLLIRFSRAQFKDLKATSENTVPAWLIQSRWGLLLALSAMIVTLVFGQIFWIFALTEGLIDTATYGVLIVIVHAMLIRWLRVAKRRLRFQQLTSQKSQVATDEGVLIEDSLSQLGEISADTQQLVDVSALALAAAAVIFIWGSLLPALDVLDRVQLWSTTTEINGELVVNQITLATVITVAILAGLTLFAARRIPAVVEIILRSRTQISAGSRYTTSTLLNYAIIAGGIILGLSALGLQWSQLQWLVAALGVGIGFGLQEIVANFISGLIILFEHPIRVGDVVTVGDKDGMVTKIRIRATTIRDWDGKELLVPNKEFITGRLLNWTLSDSQNRVVIPVGVAYGSDVEEAIRLLYKVVDEHPNTLPEPKPTIVFEHFGDNALELTARSFLDSMEDRLVIASDFRTGIYKAFNVAGIVIAFPQRDVHLDVEGPINVALQTTNKNIQESGEST